MKRRFPIFFIIIISSRYMLFSVIYLFCCIFWVFTTDVVGYLVRGRSGRQRGYACCAINECSPIRYRLGATRILRTWWRKYIYLFINFNINTKMASLQLWFAKMNEIKSHSWERFYCKYFPGPDYTIRGVRFNGCVKIKLKVMSKRL